MNRLGPTRRDVRALALVDLGVEAGQLVALAILVPVLTVVRLVTGGPDPLRRILAAGIALAGLGWTAERALG